MKKLKAFALNTLPWKIRDNYKYYRAFGRLPNLRQPQTFNEKVIYRKRFLCRNNPHFTRLADKFLVRDYVKAHIGEKYLIPLLAHFDRARDLENVVSQLEHCVVKPNHAAGMVKIINQPLPNEASQTLVRNAEQWLNTDFSRSSCEFHYKNIARKLLVEQRIGDDNAILTDYKYHLFRQPDGSVFFVLQLIDERFQGDLKRTFFVNNFTHAWSGEHRIEDELRASVEKGLQLSIALLGDLEYARIDWYIHNGQLYFGEITLTPAAGFGIGYGAELDQLMGMKWHLQPQINVLDHSPSQQPETQNSHIQQRPGVI